MKKASILKLIIIAIFFLIIVLVALYFVTKNEINKISQDELAEIELKLKDTEFLNCIYNSPEELKPYYILSVSSKLEEATQEDKAEYLYLLFEDELEELYPEVYAYGQLSNSNSDKEKYIKADLLRENEEIDFSQKKIVYNNAKDVLLENTSLTEEKTIEMLEQFKNLDTVTYSEKFDCFYFTIPGNSSLAGSKGLKCTEGSYINNIYTVNYTLEFTDTVSDTMEFQVVFSREDDKFKYISNKCIQADEIKQIAEQFENSLGGETKFFKTDTGTEYAYRAVTEKEGQLYYIDGGRKSEYYEILYIKKNNIEYYFMPSGYVYFDKSENTKYYYLNSYPRGITAADFLFIKEEFAEAIKNTK